MIDYRFILQAPIVFWCHQSSDQPFPVAGPKTRRCNIFPIWIHISPSAQNVAFQQVFSSDTDADCILTFSFDLSVPTLRRFCPLRSTIWYNTIWCNVT